MSKKRAPFQHCYTGQNLELKKGTFSASCQQGLMVKVRYIDKPFLYFTWSKMSSSLATTSDQPSEQTFHNLKASKSDGWRTSMYVVFWGTEIGSGSLISLTLLLSSSLFSDFSETESVQKNNNSFFKNVSRADAEKILRRQGILYFSWYTINSSSTPRPNFSQFQSLLISRLTFLCYVECCVTLILGLKNWE